MPVGLVDTLAQTIMEVGRTTNIIKESKKMSACLRCFKYVTSYSFPILFIAISEVYASYFLQMIMLISVVVTMTENQWRHIAVYSLKRGQEGSTYLPNGKILSPYLIFFFHIWRLSLYKYF